MGALVCHALTLAATSDYTLMHSESRINFRTVYFLTVKLHSRERVILDIGFYLIRGERRGSSRDIDKKFH